MKGETQFLMVLQLFSLCSVFIAAMVGMEWGSGGTVAESESPLTIFLSPVFYVAQRLYLRPGSLGSCCQNEFF